MLKWCIGIFFLGVGLALPVMTRLVIFSFSPLNSQSQNSSIIEIYRGENPNEITKRLTANGIIEDTKSFILLGRLTREWKKIKTGEYKLSSAMSPFEIFSTLSTGVSIAYPVTVREGENMYEIAEDLASKGLTDKGRFIKLCKNIEFISSFGPLKNNPPQSLEGYFFPDTYFFNRTLNDVEMAKQMVRHFFTYWGKRQDDRAAQLHMTRHQVVTLASIIEKETGAQEERPIISSVFHNRLKKHMRLQSDPTTIYGMWEKYRGKIHKRDLAAKNLYNTYSIDFLPIGPIANPGKEAMEAALFPTASPYLYFVSHNDGTHQFSRTFEEHNRAVQKFQVDPKARLGKSWRDHLKKGIK
jgi:UPF0755 protein